MNDGITVYRGRRLDNYNRRQIQKVLVLDLDDTLGSFSNLHILWTGILKCNKGNIDKVIGYIHSSDLFKNPKNIRSVLLPIPFVPESMLAMDMLNQFIENNKGVALVVD